MFVTYARSYCINSSIPFELQALDFVVSEARRYKIRLILSLTNNWDAYGGKAQYVKWGNEAGLNPQRLL